MKFAQRLSKDLPYPVVMAAAWSLCLLAIVAGLWVAGTALGKISMVVIPLAIAALLAALLAPVNQLLTRRLHFPRALSALLSLFGLIGLVALGVVFAVNQFASSYQSLADKAQEGATEVANWVHDGPLQVPRSDNSHSLVAQISQWAQSNSHSLYSNAVDAGTTTIDTFAAILICLIATFFFLFDGPKISRFLIGLFPRQSRQDVTAAGAAAWSTLKAYARMQIVVASINALGIGIGAWILGTPLVVPITAVVFICSFVPIVGAVVSGAIAVLIAFVDGGLTHAIIMTIIVIGVHFLETHGLQPFLMGHAVRVHPLAVVVVVAAGTYLFSLAGALFAVPITAMINSSVRAIAARHQAPPSSSQTEEGKRPNKANAQTVRTKPLATD